MKQERDDINFNMNITFANAMSHYVLECVQCFKLVQLNIGSNNTLCIFFLCSDIHKFFLTFSMILLPLHSLSYFISRM